MPKPEPYWLEFIRYNETYIRPLFVQLSEAVDGLRDSRDDWQHKQELTFQSAMGDIQASASHANASAESSKRRLDELEAKQQISDAKIEKHLGSHKLEVTEREKQALAASQEEIKARWSFREKVMVAIITGLVAIITALIALH